MKKTNYLIFIFAFALSVNAMGQRPLIELTFTAKYQMQHVPLDSIYIQNLTQPGDTVLYAPDTVLLLDYIIGIPDFPGNVGSSFSVSPNYPNPSVDGKTSIDIFIPATELVTMRAFDIIGNEVAFYENTLSAGNHHFTFLAGKEKYYVLSVNCGNEVRSVKMINSGNSPQNQGRLIYEGGSEREPNFKSQKEIAGFGFSLGNQLRFIGYAKSPLGFAGSDVIEATPEGNENYVFEILEGLPCPGIPTVFHEGQTYKTVLIGAQCWFKQNLKAGLMIDVTQNQTNNSVMEKYCYDNLESNCDVYGGLYQWDELMQYSTISGAQGLCPDGWHVTTNDEWTALTTFLGGVEFAGGKMKETDTTHWNSPNEGATNESGFTGLPGGIRMSIGAFSGIGGSGTWWSSTEQSSTFVHDRSLSTYGSWVSVGTFIKPMGLSARCVNDETFLSIPTVNTAGITEIGQTTATGGGEVTNDGGAEVTSRGVCWSTSQNPTIADSHTEDGTGTGVFVSNLTGLAPGTEYFVKAYATNSVGTAYGSELNFTTTSSIFTCGDIVTYEGQNYNTIGMGTQCWFLDNLNVGIMVTGNQTNNGVVEKYCYDNDPANCEIYGGLYDWGEVMQYSTQPGIQAICPEGWHVPTDEEFTVFTDYISSQPDYLCDNSSFNNAKAIATTTGWDTSSEYCAVGNDPSANNASGFSGMPVGFRWDTGTGFDGVGNTTAWYSSTESSGFAAKGRMLAVDYWYILPSAMSKNYGMSVRCLKDETSATIPTITTSGITDITQITATGGGEVTDDGGAEVTARGVCWSTSTNPTIADSHTSDGTGTGAFVSNLTNLTPNTPYFVRAYATNSVGTAYGNEVNFTTLLAGFTCGSTLTINHVTGEIAPVNKTVTYGTVTNIPGETSKCWITSNLGADHQATAKNDATEESAGWYWQFNKKQGYKHDGTTRTPNTTWITPISENSDWLPANDPCALELGTGWRIPTSTEWTNVKAGGNWTTWNDPWNSALKMHAAGRLSGSDGSLGNRGIVGYGWSSTQIDASDSWHLGFGSGFCSLGNSSKATGFSLRCLKDAPACGSPITINHVTGEVAPVDKTVTYGTVTNIPGEPTKCWITSNLGADHQATAVDDATEPSAGWYWQFNRKQGYKHDGTTRTPNTTWISSISENSNWIPANDPCALELGAGWRIPTKIEWTNVDASGNWTNWNGPWNSALKMHAAGYLTWSNGLLYERGNNGVYRSSTQYGIADLDWSLYFGDSWCEIAFDWGKSWGLSVRCVRDASASTIPIVSTSPVIEITQTTATSGGNVTADGGATVTARGVCWSTSQNPTIADSHTEDGTGTGVFVSNLTGLTPNTPYYVRAFATNSVGTAYGNEVNFTTLSAGFTCGSFLTINHVTGEVAPVNKTVTYGTVTNIPGETSKCWITSNLGADHQATAKDDATEPSAGWYWQFNRKQGYKHDGVTRTPNTTWITYINENSNWTTANDPCTIELGAGWRIPTKTEWTNVEASGNWTNWNGPWNSALKMHAAGLLTEVDGSLDFRGSSGTYPSSTQLYPTAGYCIYFYSGDSFVGYDLKTFGFSVRCIKE